MDELEKERIVAGCLEYLRAVELPLPLPTNAAEYASWSDEARKRPQPDENAEEAWFDLDRMIADGPDDAWEIIRELSARPMSENQCAALAAGPVWTFFHAHQATYASRIEEELSRNSGFRKAYRWSRFNDGS